MASIINLTICLIFASFFYNLINAQVCTPDVCNKHGTCKPNSSGSFTCLCDPGFTGPTCNQEIDECLSQPCANNGTCTDLENGFLCQCTPEWNGTLCTEAKNPCQSSPCGPVGKCISTNQVQIPYYCQCPDGQNTMFKCADPNPCLPNPCGPGECEITANILNGYICRCFDGSIQMTNCSAPKNPCVTTPCGSQGRCLPLATAPRGYMCMCQVDGLAYTTIDACPPSNTICTQMTCKNGGTCVPFSLNEPSCNIGQISSTCCQCPPGFTGLRCEQEVDYCSSDPCRGNGRCLSDQSSYRCDCYEGYMGENCNVKVPSSGCASNPCTVGICYQLNQNGPSYVCICPDGTLNLSCNGTGSPDNPFVLPTIPPQPTANANLVSYEEDDENNIRFRGGGSANLVPAVSTCSPTTRDACNGGQCVLVDGGVFACRCREGYTGAYCENNINECASNPCLGGGTCYDLINAYSCFCPDRVFRPQCNTTISTVPSSPILITSSNSKISNNNNVEESCSCRNGGTCYPSQGNGQVCQCPKGFSGMFCETAILNRMGSGQTLCSATSCQNGATCQEQGSSTTCVCKPGFTGQRCETEYFRCQGNGRFTDPQNCRQGRYFECVYFAQFDLNLPNGILYSRSCPPGLWFNTLNDRCDYPSVVQC